MTIQDAIKSGKPFKRELDADWAWVIAVDDKFQWISLPQSLGNYKFQCSPSDILATDWQLKEQ